MWVFKTLFLLIRLPLAFLPGGIGQNEAQERYKAGVKLQRKGQLEAAVAEYDRAIELEPSFFQAYSNRGAAYTQLGRPELTVKDLDEAIRLRPTLAVSYSNRGMAHGAMGEYARGIRDLDRAIHLNARFPDFYSSRGYLYSVLGRRQRVIQDFNRAIKLDSKFAEAYNNRADVYLALGQVDLAIILEQDIDAASVGSEERIVSLSVERLRGKKHGLVVTDTDDRDLRLQVGHGNVDSVRRCRDVGNSLAVGMPDRRVVGPGVRGHPG